MERENLTEAEELALREKFEELGSGKLDEDEQVERWKFIKSKVPGVIESGKKVVESLLTAYMKSQLGL